jgi:hypothetical protein
MSINLAILGSGLFATNAYLPALSKPSNSHVNLHTLWSRSESSVTKLSTKAAELGHSPKLLHGDEGLEAIWADKAIDAVSFVLPITAQPDLIRSAWKAGKHVLSEKPVGKDVEAARELVEEYERDWAPKGLVWRVAESESESASHIASRKGRKGEGGERVEQRERGKREKENEDTDHRFPT